MTTDVLVQAPSLAEVKSWFFSKFIFEWISRVVHVQQLEWVFLEDKVLDL